MNLWATIGSVARYLKCSPDYILYQMTWPNLMMYMASANAGNSKKEDKQEEKPPKKMTPDEEYDYLMKIGKPVTKDNFHEVFKDGN